MGKVGHALSELLEGCAANGGLKGLRRCPLRDVDKGKACPKGKGSMEPSGDIPGSLREIRSCLLSAPQAFFLTPWRYLKRVDQYARWHGVSPAILILA